MTRYPSHGLLHNMSGPARTQVNWQILPVKKPKVADSQTAQTAIFPVDDILVRFALNSGVIRAAGLKVRHQHGNPAPDADAMYRVFDTSSVMLARLKDRLEAAWDGYNLHGAILIYPWRTEIEAMTIPKNSGRQTKPLAFQIASDPLLVLNILGRAHSGILLPRLPLSFERYFLERSLCTDDARIIALARRNGG